MKFTFSLTTVVLFASLLTGTVSGQVNTNDPGGARNNLDETKKTSANTKKSSDIDPNDPGGARKKKAEKSSDKMGKNSSASNKSGSADAAKTTGKSKSSAKEAKAKPDSGPKDK